MNILTAIPLLGVNEVKFGMNRDEVRKIFGQAREFKKSKFSKNTTDDFGFCHVFYDQDNKCEAIEIFPEVEVFIDGKNVFSEDLEILKSMFSDFEEDESGFFSKKYSIGIYAPCKKTESILLGCDGYYA